MAKDSTATDPAGEDPDEDTPDDQQDDTAENTQGTQQPNDEPAVGSPRYREIQAAYTRSQQTLREREDELIRLRAVQTRQPVADPSDPLAVREARIAERERQIAWDTAWDEVRRIYSPEEVAAYQEASRNWQLDPSPLGAMRGFVAGQQTLAEKRAAASQQTKQTAAASRSEAVKPRVDTSRSDAPDPAAIDREIAGAQGRGDLKGGVAAILKRAGFPG